MIIRQTSASFSKFARNKFVSMLCCTGCLKFLSLEQLNYPKDMCYKERLQKINLLPLEFRREISDLILLFKAKYNLITLDITKHICTFNPGYKSRNHDKNDFHLIIKHNQNYFRESYFVRSAKLWNSLPPEIKSSDISASFRTRVINLYNSKLITYELPSISY